MILTNRQFTLKKNDIMESLGTGFLGFYTQSICLTVTGLLAYVYCILTAISRLRLPSRINVFYEVHVKS